MAKKIDYVLIVRFLAGETSEKENETLNEWLKSDPENRQAFEELRYIWQNSISARDHFKSFFGTDGDWEELKQRITKEQFDENVTVGNTDSEELGKALEIEESEVNFKKSFAEDSVPSPGTVSATEGKIFDPRSNRKFYSFVSIAAVFLVAIISGLSVYYLYDRGYFAPEETEDQFVLREISTTKGQQINLYLSDGTMVHLNAESRIEMPQEFHPDRREIHLKGEGYFEVAEDPDKPFIIYSEGSVVEVLGTSFGVRTYPEDEYTQVVVRNGRVSVGQTLTECENNNKVILNDLQAAHIYRETGDIETQDVDDIDLYLIWTEGFMKFRETPMDEVARQLERRYNVNVEFVDPGISELSLTAELKSRNMRNVLNVIAVSLDLDFEMDDSSVYLSKKNNNV